ncbi:MAG: PHP domain-containing protein [Finegoldia sp.]|nr:PHP domain-containing protein [Finegoldia sp.]
MIDLHIHSIASDGALDLDKILKIAKDKKLTNIAISDHDTVDKLKEIKEENLSDINIIAAIEFGISVGESEAHILGYYIDVNDKDLNEMIRKSREDRYNKEDKYIENFSKIGIEIEKEKLEKYFKNGIFSRSYLADYLVDKGYCENKNEAFKKYLGKEGVCYVKKEYSSVEEIISTIKKAGGVAILAHPKTLKNDVLVEDIIRAGIDGLEVLNSKHKKEDVISYLKLCDKYKLIYTAGSDCHGRIINGDYLLGNYIVSDKVLKRLKSLHEIRSKKINSI